MFSRRRIRALEARIEELEQRLDARVWGLPPKNDIPIEDLPTLPDYSTPYAWYCDDEDLVVWNRYGYV